MPQLHGIRVLDLSRLLPGPYCTMLLADMGADVIKVESTLLGDPARLAPPFDGGLSLSFASVNRNKRSLAINYRTPAGLALVQQLIATSDVFVESFKPGQAARLGLGYEQVRRYNPRLVYCSLSGYGQSSPYAQRSGHDLNFLALTGALDMMCDGAGRPVLPGFQLADVAGGSLFAVIAILAALLERDRVGQGQFIDISIWQGSMSLFPLQSALAVAKTPTGPAILGNLHGDLPRYGVYETLDGQWMTLAVLEPVVWAEFCRVVGREDLNEFFAPAPEQREWLAAELAALFRQRARAEWEALFADHGVCCEPVLTVEEAVGERMRHFDGQVVEISLPGRPPLHQVGSPLGLVGRQATARPAPQLGEHTVEILEGLGLSADDIDTLRSQKVIATPDETASRRLRAMV